jgi:hypothetical protein
VCGITGNNVICQGQNTSFTASGGTSYSWTGPGGFTANTASTGNISVAGEYTVTVTNANGCQSVCSRTLTVNQNPVLQITNPAAVCAPNTVNLTLAAVTAGSTLPAGTTFSYFMANGVTPLANPTTVSMSGTYIIRATGPAPTNCTVSAPVTVTINSCAITYCTYTQGYYGNPGGKSCSPAGQMSTEQLIGYAITNAGGNLVIGNGGNTFSISSGQISALIDRLPGGGPSIALSGAWTPSSYPANLLDKRGKLRNTLLSQTIALGLNLHINWNGGMSTLGMFELRAGTMYSYARTATECGNAVSTEHDPCAVRMVTISEPVVAYLQSVKLSGGVFVQNGVNDPAIATVAELYRLANLILGGGTRPTITWNNVSYQLTMEDISSVADAINNLFDGCRVFNGYQQLVCPIEMMDAVTANQSISGQSLSRSDIYSKLNVAAVPNPFSSRVRFTIESPVSGRGSLEVFNTLGQKVQTVFQGHVSAGKQQIDFAVPASVKSDLIYVFRVEGHQVTGKLMNGK